MATLSRFLLLWASTCLALWITDGIFDAVTFENIESLIMAGLVLAVLNLTVKPLIMLITLPVAILTLGLAIPLVNGLVLMLVATIVPGFELAGFWMGVLVALTVSAVSLLISIATGQARIRTVTVMRDDRDRH
jgi:putative membrane protein